MRLGEAPGIVALCAIIWFIGGMLETIAPLVRRRH